MSYFLFAITEDGEVRFEELTDEALEARLAEETSEDYVDPLRPEHFFEAKPPETDPMYWMWKHRYKRYLLIRGEVVVPKIVERVTRMEVP